jgi:hypothetical protein
MRIFSLRTFAPLTLSLAALVVGASASCGGDGASSTSSASGSGGSIPCPLGTELIGASCVDVEECATDNGGCGDPELFACEDREAAAPRCTFDPSSDLGRLIDGVETLDSGGAVPSAMVVFGEQAFPVVVDSERRAFVSGARVGKGRVVAYAHEAFLAGGFDGGDDRGRLVDNAVRWASGKTAPVVGLGPGLGELAARLAQAGLATKDVSGAELGGIDVLVTSTYSPRPDQELAAIAAFVAGGGGLVTGGQAWSSADQFPPVALAYPGNRLLADAGIVVTDRYAGMGKSDVTTAGAGPLLHAGRALERLAAHVSGETILDEASQLVGADTVGFAVEVLPIAVAGFFERASAILEASPPPVPSEAMPVEPAKAPIAALELRIESKLARELPASKVKEHAAAKDFPGSVPSAAATITRTLTVDGTYEGRAPQYVFSGAREPVWRGTGLYAAPGAVVRVTLAPEHAGKGLAVRIGSHSDSLWQSEAWTRFPAIDRVDALSTPETEVASAFGGLIHVTVPAGATLGPVSLTIEGAVEAPRFVAGKTTPAEWLVAREAPGPWAELESSKFVLTVPSALVRTLVDPQPILGLWDAVLDASADLAAIPRTRARAERFVVDRQISAGYMHSGYPIMAHLDAGPMVLDVAAIEKDGLWGPFHELGHNHQWGDWVLPGTIESSVNLWSVYISENVFGLPRSKAHPALDPAERAKRLADHLAKGAPFEEWQVWTALETYLQLQEAFGWQPFQDVFAAYRSLAADAVPKTDAERIDAFCLRFAKTVGKDLGPFFVAWGLPLSEAAKAEMAKLPAWSENPLAK